MEGTLYHVHPVILSAQQCIAHNILMHRCAHPVYRYNTPSTAMVGTRLHPVGMVSRPYTSLSYTGMARALNTYGTVVDPIPSIHPSAHHASGHLSILSHLPTHVSIHALHAFRKSTPHGLLPIPTTSHTLHHAARGVGVSVVWYYCMYTIQQACVAGHPLVRRLRLYPDMCSRSGGARQSLGIAIPSSLYPQLLLLQHTILVSLRPLPGTPHLPCAALTGNTMCTHICV